MVDSGKELAEQLGLVPATVLTRCRTVNGTGRVTRHTVTVNADWTVTTGHDIDSERVAAALGGRLSCLDLVDHSVPAARYWLRGQLRDGPPAIASDDGKSWHPADPSSCCPRTGFPDPAKAADHVRSERHARALHSAPTGQLSAFVRHWSPLLEQLSPPPRTRRDRRLWDCGLTPRDTRGIEAELSATDPLPVELHLAILAQRPDLTWLKSAMTATNHHMPVATWLVWESRQWEKLALPTRLEWLTQPIPPRLALLLATAEASPQEMRQLAASQNRTVAWAATQLATWAQVGLHPPIGDLIALAGSDRGLPAAPSRSAITRAREEFPSMNAHPDEAVALALAKHGYAQAAATALAQAGNHAPQAH